MEKKTAEGCPSCASLGSTSLKEEKPDGRVLSQWPIQIKLMGSVVPFLDNADLLVAADCTAFAVKDFHERFLGEMKLLIGCPKLDNAQFYVDKFTEIFTNNSIKSLACLRMEVPCCSGMTAVLKEAIKRSGRTVPFKETVIGVKGDVIGERSVSRSVS